ncbi:MAG: PucR family transcriptional regulator, purine catabolism regulatory protein [Nocardioidaceae bacterium]|jgi:purine catabolism regulator|nr:PucR family transcriptional regulator, purine catabolism regulatory protein [Nocardioidaceae bacterium]
MLPTIREILATPIVTSSDPEVLAGHDQLDRPVRWMHPAEVSDIAHLLRGDEVVLTTGSFLSEDVAGSRAYVASLADAGVAGLFVELGRHWQAPPQALVTACSEEGLVLVVMHREVRFATVVEEVGAVILEAQVDDLRASEQIHETFTRLDLDAAEPGAVLAEVVRIAGVPVVLESWRHQVIEYDAAGHDAKELLADWNRVSKAITRSGRTGFDRRRGWLVTVVGSRGDHWGRLVLVTGGVPGRRDYVLVERAAATLTLHQMRTRARDSVERNTHTTLLADLRAGRASQEIALMCENFGFPTRSRAFFALALRLRTGGVEKRRMSLPDLAAFVASSGRALNIPILVGLDTDHVVGLVSLPPGMSSDLVMTKLVGELAKVTSVTIARGEVVERLELTNRTLVDARSILAATDTDDARPWVTLADVHLRGLLHLLREDERLVLFVRRELGPLMAYDTEHGSDFLGLLETYLETAGGKATAAKRLLLSRPVLYERLAKIGSILAVDLDDPHVRSSLHVAVMAKRIVDDDLSPERAFSDKM